MPALSETLYREVRPEFFRVLSGGLARLYVDVLDALDVEAGRRSQGLDREEALGLVEQVVESHAADLAQAAESRVSDAPEDLIAARTLRERALAVYDTLRRAGWISEEENRSDYRQRVLFDANGNFLLQALRKIAHPEGAVFSDKLLHVCNTLAHRETMADQPWAQIESCVAALELGLAELRGMQKSIERHTRKQLSTISLRENLEVLFDQFAERIGRNCYSQLVQARLPARLAEARRALEELGQADPLNRMQAEVMRREPSMAPDLAMARVRLRLDELSQLLDQVEPLADAIDRRTAEFTRRSHARSRYLQETTSENRATVQSFFETLNRRFAGRRLSELEDLHFSSPDLRLVEVRIPGGLETLYTPRLRRAAGELEALEESDPRHQDRALIQLEGTLRDSLTVTRANQFVARLPGSQGESVSSDLILRDSIHNDEDMASLIACLLHARAKDARYRVETDPRDDPSERPVFDSKLGYRVERFTVVKT